MKGRKDMKIGFIGLGNMASAIIGGMLQKGAASAEQVIGFDVSEAAREAAKTKFDIQIGTDNVDVAQQADILFLAVKPIYIEEVAKEIKNNMRNETVIVSIAAGKTLAFLQNVLGDKDRKIVRCMPNTPALVLEGWA